MALQSYTANDITYSVSPEPATPLGFRTWAVIRGRLLDEMTGRPPNGGISIDSPSVGISPRVAAGGLVAFAAIPVLAFSNLKHAPYTVAVNLQADGYIPIFRSVPIAQDLTFPNTFAPFDMGDMALHRLPTEISGRVVVDNGITPTAVVGAALSLSGLWRTPPPANLVVPPDPPDLVSLNPGIYFDCAAAGSQVQGLNFQGVPGPDKQMIRDAPAGQSQLRLSDRILITANDVLAIDTADSERTEYVAIQSVAGATADNLPATVTLVSNLQINHRQGATVHKVQFQNVGPVIALTQDAIPGDVCAFVNGVANLAAAPFISLQQGVKPVEYHAARYFQAVSDAQGFFQFPPISRVAQCAVHCHDGVHPDPNPDPTHRPDYDSEVSRIDFVYH
jgi:hypothetical protein